MATRNIVKLGNPVLREHSREVTVFDEKLGVLIDDMIETVSYTHLVIVVSSDPITAVVEKEKLGALCVSVCCNDVAANGGEPVAMTITLIMPPSSSAEDVSIIMRGAVKRADELNAVSYTHLDVYKRQPGEIVKLKMTEIFRDGIKGEKI